MFKVLLLALCLSGCWQTPKTESCGVPQVSRCSTSNTVELCGPQGQWLTVMQCSKMGPTWQCFSTADGPACLEAPDAHP